jgi:hypothetical protein
MGKPGGGVGVCAAAKAGNLTSGEHARAFAELAQKEVRGTALCGHCVHVAHSRTSTLVCTLRAPPC